MMDSGEEEIRDIANAALRHTGVILTRSLKLDETWDCGAASAVYVVARKRAFAVSCRHVVANSDECYVNCSAVEPTLEGLLSMPPSSRSWPVEVWTAADLAVFDVDREVVRKNKREFLDLDSTSMLKKDDLKLGLSAFITAICAKLSHYESVLERVQLSAFRYTAKGEITDVHDHTITARFEENMVLDGDGKHKDDAAQIVPEGKSRNLKGMSGSGLWIAREDGGVSFAGILCRPGTEKGDPDIVFTPVWDVVRFVDLCFPRDSSLEEDMACP